MTRPLVSNKCIYGALNFKDVLDAIDFERLAQTSKPLYARAVLYCADKSPGTRRYREFFEGEIREEAGCLILPRSRLSVRGQVGNQPTELDLGQTKTTLGLLISPNTPKEYEFSIDGIPSDNYKSIELFSSTVLRALAEKDALNYNPNHASHGGFYLSDDKAKPYQVPILMISGSGLEVLADSVGGIKVFTQKDLERFADLG